MRNLKFEIYKDGIEEWRWSFLAGNGETIAVSSESYQRKQDCLHSIHLIQSSQNSKITEVDTSKSRR